MLKIRLFSMLTLIVWVMFVTACASSVSNNTSASSSTVKPAEISGYKTLDQAIKEAAGRIDEQITAGTKIAILNINSSSDQFSLYVIDELTANFLDTRKLTVIDRKEIDLIRGELNFQLSGEVSDDSMQELGKILGAQAIVSGSLMEIGDSYRIVIRTLSVQTAIVEVQYRTDIANDNRVRALLTTGKSANTGNTSVSTGTNRPTSPVTDIIVSGANLTEKLAWLQRSADSHNTYILEVNANENIAPHTFEYRGAINITVVLRGVGANRTVRLRTHGTMFTVRPNVTFILDNNITLQGHSGNIGALVRVEGGIFKMNTGSAITGNINTFRYDGITHNHGGGVHITSSGIFEMNGGTIAGNTADISGGVDVNDGIFTMTGGTIVGNTARRAGGGVGVNDVATFAMRGGNITGNTAQEHGGGVSSNGIFNKTGGTITGYANDQSNGNVVRDDAGNVIARNGHAVYVTDINGSITKRKETTAGSGVNLSNSTAGGWDN